jgi:PD-(D/E)XK nuclease superfamily/Domain of unknown function (DUF2357)
MSIKDSAPTSRLAFLDSKGQPLDLPREWEPGYVAIDAPVSDWNQVSLTCNGARLDVYAREVAGDARVVAEWPRSGTGHYELDVTHGREREKRQITVWPRKITRSGYTQLLEDLDELPPAIAVALQQSGALAGAKFAPRTEATLSSELERLRRAVNGTTSRPGLARVLQALAPDPHVVLVGNEVMLPRERVRRIQPARLAQAYASSRKLDRAGHPERLPDYRVQHTADVYENRLVRVYHDQVQRHIRRLHARIRPNSRAAATATELDQLGKTLASARREATFLDDVTLPRQLPRQLTMVLLRRAEYRAAFEGYLEFHRTLNIQLDEPALDSPLENLPSLYEAWGTLQVIRVLADVAVDLGFTATEQLFHRDQSGLFLRVLRNGRPALELKRDSTQTTVKLIPQQTYSASGKPLSSASYSQTPDVAIEIEHPGCPTRVLVLDPKYKLESEELENEITDGWPKKVDIDKMHAYRDAIRDGANRRPVEYAAILFPGGATERFGPGLEALAARPGEETNLANRLREVLIAALDIEKSAPPEIEQPAV